MRRLVVLLVAVVGVSIQPALADDLNARQADVRQQLAAAAAEISQLNLQMASLERSVTGTQQRIQRERAQVRMLARALYAQPDSLVATVFESASISEALTRIADLTSAGDRAASTKRELDRDLMALSRQRAQLQSDRDRQAQLQQELEAQYGKLVQQAVALRVQNPAPPPAPLPTDPASVAAIKQIILTAFAPLGSAGQTWALRVAQCESNYNPYAVNRSSGASGLFQFLPSTWASLPQHNQSVFDPTANAQAAEVLYSRSGPNQWSCK
jgi:soluble lytic murein transglycosylase-like protein